MDAQKISMYQAHFLHKQGKLTEAVSALERTYEMYQDNPNALFLAVHWLLESGDEKAAEEYYMRALACAERSRRDYSEIVEDVEEKFRDYRAGANGSK